MYKNVLNSYTWMTGAFQNGPHDIYLYLIFFIFPVSMNGLTIYQSMHAKNL